MLGDVAVARGAYEAGARVATAYPGTPSTEITEEISKYEEVYSEWAPNEKVAAEVGIGAAMHGARTLVSMKHVGLNVCADPLFTAAYAGVNAGLVFAVADDPGMFSSQNEQDTRLLARAAHIPVLEPSDSREAKEFTKLAFDLSEEYDTPVIVRLTTRVAHSRCPVELGERVERNERKYVKDSDKYVMVPARARRRRAILEERMRRLSEACDAFDANRIERRDSKIGIIASGIAYQYARDAVPNASVLKLGMTYPLPLNLIREFRNGVERCIVVEELEPHIETLIKAEGIDVEGKNLFKTQGEYSVGYLRERLFGEERRSEPSDISARPPALCAGCPHRAAFYALKKMNLSVMGDIGCYTLGSAPPLSALDSTICMGASIGMAIGAGRANPADARRTVAVIGDSTFAHSGIAGLIDAVYNGSDVTVVILDNRTTAMTGHQDNPVNGRRITGEPTIELDLEKLCRSLSVDYLVTVDPFDLESFRAAVEAGLAVRGVSVIIAKRPCALLPGARRPALRIADGCRKCLRCVGLGCPAIGIGPSGAPVISSASCVGCGLCRSVCPFGAIVEEGGRE